ncbi:MAG: MBL fold metallo-hydrolase [Lachnospiraceae bacterium]|nr:MBL fold metallo-hydrolase [Lachnospiraceae bacterium]
MGELKIGRMVMGAAVTNVYFLYREGEKDVLVFDPAAHGDMIYQKLSEHGFTVRGIYLTHGHFDHIYGLKALKELTGADVFAYEEERELCGDVQMNVSDLFGRSVTAEVDTYLSDGAKIGYGNINGRLIATPGHTQGSCCYYFEEDGILISGDTLFEESVGRTDFPTGSTSKLVRSIQDKLFVLPDDTKVFPGHGEQTTIGHEKKYNPVTGGGWLE